jgi:ubiquinol-cytochrome c reductase cytochrome b subunit
LGRFYALHTFLPFVVSEIVVLHIALAHSDPGGSPLGNDYGGFDLSWFHPYFYTKDMVCTFIVLFLFSVVVFFYPNYLSHPDNYNMANPMVTPSHIVPE